MRRILLVLGVGGVVVMALALQGLRANARRDRDQLAALSATVSQLQRRPPAVVRLVEAASTGPLPTPTVFPHLTPAEAPEGAAPAGSRPIDKQRTEAAMDAKLSSVFADQPIDRNWAANVHGQIMDVVRAAGIASNVEAVECRTSVCRITSTFPSTSSYNRFSDEVGGRVPDGDGLMTPAPELREDGSVHAVSYWMRSGQVALAFPPADGRPPGSAKQ